MKKQAVKWARFRHKATWFLLKPAFFLYARMHYGARIEKYADAGKTPCVYLYNHVTGFDQFFVALSFARPIYFVATEDIFSLGFLSKALSFLVAPIPIKKHSTDIKALKNILTVVKEGNSIAIAPEGNRTYSGRTVHMKDSIVSLIKKLKIDIVLFKIEGGYGVQPRWSDVVRKGRIDCRIAKVIKPSEYLSMSGDELYDCIKKTLYTDEANTDHLYKHAKKAEFLERAMYVCPDCGFTTFESNGNVIRCNTCNKEIKYKEDTSLEGVGFKFPYRFVADWYEYQNNYVNQTDLTLLTDKPVYEDMISIYKVIPYKRKETLDKAVRSHMYGDRIELSFSGGTAKTIRFDEIAGIACMGRNKLNVETKDGLFQIRGSKRFNALKYLNFCYRYKNIVKGEDDDKFLGI